MTSINSLLSHLTRALPAVDPNQIEAILEPLRTLLELDAADPARRLTIRRLRFSGAKSGDFLFGSGVNVIRAGNDKGKSSLLKLIHFGLTGRNELKKDVDDWIEHVELELGLDGIPHRLSIDKSKRPRGTMALGTLDGTNNGRREGEGKILFEFSNGKDMQGKLEAFFNRAFRLRALPGTQKDSRKASDALLDSVTSYRAYVRGFYINQDRGYTDLVTDGIPYGSLFMKVVGMLLGLSGIDARFAVEAQLAHVENALGKEERYTRKVEKALGLRDLSTIDSDIGRVASYVDELKSRRDRRRSGALSEDLDRRLDHITQQWLALIAARSELAHRAAEKEAEVVSLRATLERLVATVESRRALAPIQPQTCPACDTRIEHRTRFVEPRNETECLLCHEDLPSITTTTTSSLMALEKRARTIRQSLEEADLELESLLQEETARKVRDDQLDRERSRLRARISASNLGTSDLDREIEIEIRYLGRLEAERDNATQIVAGADGSKLEKLLIEKQVISESLRWIKDRNAKVNEQLKSVFARRVRELCVEIGFPGLEEVRMGPQLKPVIQQNGKRYSFQELSPGEKVRFVLAFYLALAMTAGERRHQDGSHPGLLLIDSPGKEEMVHGDFEAVVSLLQLIEREHSDSLQVIVASSLPAIGNATDPGKRIFIDNDDQPLF